MGHRMKEQNHSLENLKRDENLKWDGSELGPEQFQAVKV
jgi:hypothetical protein